MKKRNVWLILIAALLLAAGGGYAAYANFVVSPAEATPEPQVQTTTVRRGDLIITASGTGTLVPAQEVEVGFLNGGVLVELMVEAGDRVKAGDVLARLDDTDGRKAVADAELQMAQAEATLDEQLDTTAAEQAVAQAEIQVTQAEVSLASAQLNLAELLDWMPDESAVALAQANLAAAYADYERVVALGEHADDQLTQTRINLENARNQLAYAQADYDTAWSSGRDWESYMTDPTGEGPNPTGPSLAKQLESERESTQRKLVSAQLDLEAAQAAYNLAVLDTGDSDLKNAWSKVVSAQASLEDAQTGPSESDIEAARLQVQQAEHSLTQAQLSLEADQLTLEQRDTAQAELSLTQAWLNLEAAQRNLEQTTLVAPMDGTVMAVEAQVGESVSATPIITLADLEEPQVLFWVEETDLASVAPGNAVNIVFEALPDYTFPGKILSVDPLLVTVDNTPAVQSRASVDLSLYLVTPLSGMNAEVEIVAGEARDALLVPIQALRELGPDQYAVFVVQPNGELEMHPVEVGLKDYVNAEILSGLEEGQVVSTGELESTGDAGGSTTGEVQPPGGGMMPFLGGQ